MKTSNLLISRFFFYLFILMQVSPQRLLGFANFPSEFWMPTGIFQIFDHPIYLSTGTIQIISSIWYLTGTLSALNIRFKESSIGFAILNLFVFNTAHNYGYQTHSLMILVLGAFLLAFGKEKGPLMMRMMFCAVFFSAGLSKVRNGGLEWIFSDSLQNMLIRSQIFYSDAHQWASSLNINIFIARNKIACSSLAALTLALELLAPLALVRRSFALVLIPSLLLMQIAIYFTILVKFKFYPAIYIFWIDWEGLFQKVGLNRYLPSLVFNDKDRF